jgi:hypothetical protein
LKIEYLWKSLAQRRRLRRVSLCLFCDQILGSGRGNKLIIAVIQKEQVVLNVGAASSRDS